MAVVGCLCPALLHPLTVSLLVQAERGRQDSADIRGLAASAVEALVAAAGEAVEVEVASSEVKAVKRKHLRPAPVARAVQATQHRAPLELPLLQVAVRPEDTLLPGLTGQSLFNLSSPPRQPA